MHYHGKVEESYIVLKAESGFDAVQIVHEVLPDTETKSDWWDKAVEVMTTSNRLKFNACKHAQEMLLDTNVVLVEATSNVFWGSGLNPEKTMSTLSDYWPGQNYMGKLLVCLHDELMQESFHSSVEEAVAMSDKKRKATSPLVGDGSKYTKNS